MAAISLYQVCSTLLIYLISVLYCLENAFVSYRLHTYRSLWLLGALLWTPFGISVAKTVDPLCPPYLQTLATPLAISTLALRRCGGW